MIDMFEKNIRSGRTVLEDIEVGVPFYMVHGLGEQSYLTELTPIAEPCISEHSKNLFVKCEQLNSARDGVWTHSHSVKDMGIIPNKYNAHQSFNDRESAEEYLALALKIPRTPLTAPFMSMFTSA